jgi:hypothetical protein
MPANPTVEHVPSSSSSSSMPGNALNIAQGLATLPATTSLTAKSALSFAATTTAAPVTTSASLATVLPPSSHPTALQVGKPPLPKGFEFPMRNKENLV